MFTFVIIPSFSPAARKRKTTTMIRKKLVSVRLSEAQYARLAAAAATASTSPSAFMRDFVFASFGMVSAPAPLASTPAGVGTLVRMVSIRLTVTEAERLAEQARDCELPVATYARLVLRGSSPSLRRSDARAAVMALSRVGNNLNQLTRLAHGGTFLSRDLSLAVETLRADVYRVRDEILAAQGGRP
jgi:hypothetical protein